MAVAEKVCIELRKDILEKAKKLAESSGFSSLEEYIVFLVEESLEVADSGEVFSDQDEEKVKERLKDLGYI